MCISKNRKRMYIRCSKDATFHPVIVGHTAELTAVAVDIESRCSRLQGSN